MKNTNYRNKTKTIKINRLFHGQASIRDYVLNDIIRGKLDLIIQCGNEKMFIPNRLIYQKGKRSNIACVSKFNGKKYRLIDFSFRPNQTNPNQQNLFQRGISYEI